MSLPTTDPNLHIVQESWESDPTGPESRAVYVASVCRGIEWISDHPDYVTALRKAAKLNRQQRTVSRAS